MRSKVKERSQDSIAENQCHHYWVIEIASGPTSKGVCKYCGQSKDFLNTIPDLSTLKQHSPPPGLPEMPDAATDEEPEGL